MLLKLCLELLISTGGSGGGALKEAQSPRGAPPLPGPPTLITYLQETGSHF